VDPSRAPGESDINWFQREPGPPEPDRYPITEARGAHHAEPFDDALPGSLQSRSGPIGPRSGQPLPPLPPEPAIGAPLETPHFNTESLDRETLHRARGGLLRLGDGVYRGRRPAMAALLSVLTVLFEVPAVRIFASGFRHISASATISGTFLVIALPMFALGLYALGGGAAVAPGQGVRAWLRTPLAYLPLALLLFLAAALAA
jgi:hypothetical protein